MSDTQLRRRMFRRHMIRLVIPLLYLVPTLYFGLFALALGPDDPPTTGQRIAYAIIALPFLVLAVRTFRIAVVTEPSGVTIRGVLRTRRIPWSDVDSFVMGEWGGFDCGAVRRRDGSEQTAFALNPPLDLGDGPDARTQWLLSELNGELEKARAAGLAGGPERPAPHTPAPRAPASPPADAGPSLF